MAIPTVPGAPCAPRRHPAVCHDRPSPAAQGGSRSLRRRASGNRWSLTLGTALLFLLACVRITWAQPPAGDSSPKGIVPDNAVSGSLVALPPEAPRPSSGETTVGTNARAHLQDEGETVPATPSGGRETERERADGPTTVSGPSEGAGLGSGPATVSAPRTPAPTAPASTADDEGTPTTMPAAPDDHLEAEPIRRGGRGRKAASLAVGADEVSERRDGSGGVSWGLLWRSLSGLAIVLGLMVLGMLLLKRAAPSVKRGGSEAVTILGRTYVGPKHALHLVKIGRRILILGQTPAGMSSIAEISDPEEVEQVTASCQRSRSTSITKTFRQLLGRERDAFTDPFGAPKTERQRAKRPTAVSGPFEGPGLGGGLPPEDGELGTRDAGFLDAEASEMEEADEAEQVGLMRQEVDLILDRVRRWRGGNRTDDVSDA